MPAGLDIRISAPRSTGVDAATLGGTVVDSMRAIDLIVSGSASEASVTVSATASTSSTRPAAVRAVRRR